MTSEEALGILYSKADTTNECWECRQIIEKDLEILKLLKELLKGANILKKNEIDISKYVAIITNSTSEILKEWMEENDN